MGEFVGLRLFAPLLDRLGVDQPALRADLASAQLIGLGMARYVLRFEPLASAAPEDVVAWTAPSLQRYLTGKLDS